LKWATTSIKGATWPLAKPSHDKIEINDYWSKTLQKQIVFKNDFRKKKNKFYLN